MENKGKAGRKSNIELMRIIAMIMIVFYHYKIHADNGNFAYSSFSTNKIIAILLGSWGSVGVYMFLAISSYFLTRTNELQIYKVVSLLIKTSFFGIVILIISNVTGITTFSVIKTIKAAFGALIYQYWFITLYIFLLLLSPCQTANY